MTVSRLSPCLSTSTDSYPTPLSLVLSHSIASHPVLSFHRLHPILASFPVLCHPVFTIFKYSTILSFHFFFHFSFCLIPPSFIPSHPTFPVIIQSHPFLSCAPFHFLSHPIPSYCSHCDPASSAVLSYPSSSQSSILSWPCLCHPVFIMVYHPALPKL